MFTGILDSGDRELVDEGEQAMEGQNLLLLSRYLTIFKLNIRVSYICTSFGLGFVAKMFCYIKNVDSQSKPRVI